MKHVSEQQVREEASNGKNKEMAKTPKVVPQQNAEVQPPRSAARAERGTDESKKRE